MNRQDLSNFRPDRTEHPRQLAGLKIGQELIGPPPVVPIRLTPRFGPAYSPAIVRVFPSRPAHALNKCFLYGPPARCPVSPAARPPAPPIPASPPPTRQPARRGGRAPPAAAPPAPIITPVCQNRTQLGLSVIFLHRDRTSRPPGNIAPNYRPPGNIAPPNQPAHAKRPSRNFFIAPRISLFTLSKVFC